MINSVLRWMATLYGFTQPLLAECDTRPFFKQSAAGLKFRVFLLLDWLLYQQLRAEKMKSVKLATIVEGDLKAPFSIATTPRCRGGCYSFPWTAALYS